MITRHIVARGGSGFSRNLDNPLLDYFVFQLSGKLRPGAGRWQR